MPSVGGVPLVALRGLRWRPPQRRIMAKKRTRTKAKPAPAKAPTTKVVARSAPVPRPRITVRDVQNVCGLTDPFCAHANGCKYPDDSSAKTLAYTYHTRTTVSTTAAGDAYLLFAPQYGNAPFTQAATIVAPSTVLTWDNFAVYSPIANAEAYRIVSWGLRLKRICAPLTTQGMVLVRSMQQESGQHFQPIDLSSFSRSEVLDLPLQDAKPITIVGKHSSQRPEAFYQVNTDAAAVVDWDARGFTPVTINVVGGPASTAVLDIEIIIHYELMFTEDSGLGMLSTPPPPHNPIITNAAARLTSTTKSFFTETASRISLMLERKAAQMLGNAVGSAVGIPGLGNGLSIVVD